MENVRELFEASQLKKIPEINPELIASIEPTGWHILIEVSEIEKKSAGGILLDPMEGSLRREQSGRQFGVVKAIGPDAWSRSSSPWASIGDTVFFKRYSGPELRFKSLGKIYFCINDEDVFSRISPELAEFLS